jgi:predicted alpha/beta-hydrolase family hydrolase
VPTVRFDFPYRRAGRRAPDRAPVLVEAVRREAAALGERLGVGTDRLVHGGRSMGGRMCTQSHAEGLPVAGLVLVSYPLHPPGKPDKLRIEHFPAMTAPCLFVHGARDPFGSPDELTAHTAAIAGPVEHVWLKGGHDLKGGDAAVAAAVAAWIARLP